MGSVNMVRTAGVKGSSWYVSIGGFRDISVGDVDRLLSQLREAASPCLFQLFDADRVAGWRHLFFAAVNAVKAFEAGAAISRSLAVEVLLYVSCQDQISKALPAVGLSPKTKRTALLVLEETPKAAENAFRRVSGVLGTADDSVQLIDDDKFEEIKRFFNVSEPELDALGGLREEALTWLLVERGALLSVRR